MNDSILFLSDSYKVTHWKQYPPGTEKIYSYFESRGGKFPKTVFFGLQYFLKEYLEGARVSAEDIEQASRFYQAHFGQDLFHREGWEHILRQHGGHLPVSIKAVPEGTVLDTHNVLMTIENTDPACYWLTNFLETLLVQVWYPMTVATLSYHMREMILDYLQRTGDPSGIDFKLHDFGFRGVSSVESAGLGGAAHLLNFQGTDTVAGIRLAQRYYGRDLASPMFGFSIPASEHSTITAWGREKEPQAMANMLEQYPAGLVACVSDSYNIFLACEEVWGRQLKEKILGRDGTLVVRPDSGSPPVIVLQVLDILGKNLGYTVNEKGFRVLPPQVRVIQGDGIDLQMCRAILSSLHIRGWSADNIAFGMGGALLQKLDRDTQKCAFKCAAATIDGEEREVFKAPVTDPGKRSKAGRLKLVAETDGTFHTVATQEGGEDQLVEVFRDGRLLQDYSFEQVRERVKSSRP